MAKRNYNPTNMGYSGLVGGGKGAPDKITFIKTKEMKVTSVLRDTLFNLIHPKTTGTTIYKQNKKALKKETVLIILKDQKNAKVNKELRKQVFNNYCGIYTNVVILKDTDIKIGGELRVLRGISFDSIILKCFLATPIYEYLHEVLFMKMLQSIEKDIRNLPKPPIPPDVVIDKLEIGI